MTTLFDARAAWARSSDVRDPVEQSELAAGVEQRARLMEALLADLSGEKLVVRCGALPPEILSADPHNAVFRPSTRLAHYASDVVRCSDGAWRVARGRAGIDPVPNTACASLLEAPVLATFLPHLCRVLLGEPLRLASLPTHWLADRATQQMLVADASRWSIGDAFDPDLPTTTLADLSPERRVELQRTVGAAPWRFVANLLLAPEDLVSRVCLTIYAGLRPGEMG